MYTPKPLPCPRYQAAMEVICNKIDILPAELKKMIVKLLLTAREEREGTHTTLVTHIDTFSGYPRIQDTNGSIGRIGSQTASVPKPPTQLTIVFHTEGARYDLSLLPYIWPSPWHPPITYVMELGVGITEPDDWRVKKGSDICVEICQHFNSSHCSPAQQYLDVNSRYSNPAQQYLRDKYGTHYPEGYGARHFRIAYPAYEESESIENAQLKEEKAKKAQDHQDRIYKTCREIMHHVGWTNYNLIRLPKILEARRLRRERDQELVECCVANLKEGDLRTRIVTTKLLEVMTRYKTSDPNRVCEQVAKKMDEVEDGNHDSLYD